MVSGGDAETGEDRLTAPGSELPGAPLEAEQPPEESPVMPPADPLGDQPILATVPERTFAARVLPPDPRPRATARRAVFFDVENTSRAEHIERVLRYLTLDWVASATELVAVGNWRVIGHETARLLARHGAQLVHSAPSLGVRDWSDLRIAVAAGVWLAGARPGDVLDVVTDDQAFDAVGDVAASLGVAFRRHSYRALAGIVAEAAGEEEPSRPRSRRRRRGGRRAAPRGDGGRATAAPANGAELEVQGHTAPHDELLAVVRQLAARAPERSVSIDAVSNALKARGFSRPSGSLRLIVRLRRLKELEVSRNGTIRLLDTGPADHVAESATESEPIADETAAAPPRRRRRRGGRRRRGRGGGQAAVAAP